MLNFSKLRHIHKFFHKQRPAKKIVHGFVLQRFSLNQGVMQGSVL